MITKNKNAFTLIEALVSVAITAIGFAGVYALVTVSNGVMSDTIDKEKLKYQNTEIIAFNGNDNAITNYTSINNNNLYSDTGSSSKSYSSLDIAFSSNLPTKITNDYNSHNNIDDADKRAYDRQMSYHMNSINNSNNTNF